MPFDASQLVPVEDAPKRERFDPSQLKPIEEPKPRFDVSKLEPVEEAKSAVAETKPARFPGQPIDIGQQIKSTYEAARITPEESAAAFEPLPGVKAALDSRATKFAANALLDALPGMRIAQQIGEAEAPGSTKAVTDKFKNAVASILSPGGLALAATGPAALELAAGVGAALSVPIVAEGVKEVREAKTPAEVAGGVTQTAIGLAGVVGGGAEFASRLLPRSAAALKETPPPLPKTDEVLLEVSNADTKPETVEISRGEQAGPAAQVAEGGPPDIQQTSETQNERQVIQNDEAQRQEKGQEGLLENKFAPTVPEQAPETQAPTEPVVSKANASEEAPSWAAPAIPEPTPLDSLTQQEARLQEKPDTNKVESLATDQATAVSEQGNPTAMKYRLIDAERAQRGLEPLYKGATRSDQALLDQAAAVINNDPLLPERLVAELNIKARPISDLENHVLLLSKIELRREYQTAVDEVNRAAQEGRTEDLAAAQIRRLEASDRLTDLEEASRASGSARGAALRSLRVMANEDFSLASMESDLRAAKGGERLTEKEQSQVESIHKEYQDKIKALEGYVKEADQRTAEAQAARALAEIRAQAAQGSPTPQIARIVERIGMVLDKRAQAARERLSGKLFTLSPDVLKDLAEIGASNIYHIGVDLAKWSAKMIEDVGERIRPYLSEVFEASKKLVDSTADETARGASQEAKARLKANDTPAQRKEKLTEKIKERVADGKVNDIGPLVQRLARSFVQLGITGRDELIDAVHGVLEQLIPKWTRRQTMDAISGYGDFKALSKDEISLKLRDLKGQMQQIGKLEDMANKQAPLRTGIERREPSKAESELIKLVNEAKRRGGYETTDPTRQLRSALEEVKKRTQSAIDEYQRRINEEDFAVRKLDPVKPDDALLQKQADLARVQKRYQQLKTEFEKKNRSAWQKGLDKFVRWERAFKLSSPVVFGKLAAAALTRVVTTGVEEGVGAVLGKIPGISTVARQAPREGGINVPGMAKALTKAVTKGMRDAYDTARRGASNLDILYGDKLVDKDWANIFGQLHGMLKAPVKRAEFELSLEKRIQSAIKNGIDVQNPLVMTRLMTEALNDGYRAIFMQRGLSSDIFNQTVTQLEKLKKPGYQPTGEILARLARFFLPVVRVPANIVAETATGIHGIPTASARVMFHIMKGTLDKLDPVVADSILRQFKKGSIGLGLVALGYFNPQAVGGFDWREKRKPGTVKTAGFQIPELAGVYPVDKDGNVPRWLTHAPWFELMQFGATIRHVKDQHVKGQEKGISEGMWAAGLGLIEETPLVNEMLHFNKIFNPSERGQYLGELAKGTLVPQAVQKIAEMTDKEEARKPKGVIQAIESGIPGLRQNVPVKPKK